MIRLNPYLTFDGDCREAMTFYRDCLGGELTLQTVAETPMAAQCPAGMQDRVMHAAIENDGFVLMGTDMRRPGEAFRPGNDTAISLDFDSEEEMRECFAELSGGGEVVDPLADKPWGALFGVVQDRFGKVWMLTHEKEA
jgi:PhnB protein